MDGRTSTMRAALLIAVMAFVLSHDTHGALPTLELLSPQNLHRLEQVGQIRRGTLEEIAWSPGEDMIAVAGSGGLRLFSLIDGREQALLSNAGGVNDVDFSPDGLEIVAAGDDGLLHIWDSQTGVALRALNPYSDLECACTYRLTSAKYDSPGKYLWVGAENGPLRVVDAVTGTVVSNDTRLVLEIHPNRDRTSFAISEQRSAHVTLWPASGPFTPERDLDVRFTVWNAAFVPDSPLILVAGFVGAELMLVNTETSETVAMIRGSRVLHVNATGSVATQVIDWFGGQRRISLRITKLASGALQFNSSLPVELTDVRFSPSGEYLAISGADGSFTVWDWRRNLRVLDVPAKGTALVGLAMLDNGLVAALDSEVGVVQSLTRTEIRAGSLLTLWDIVTGREVGGFRTTDYGLTSADVLYWDRRIARLIVGSSEQLDVQLELDPVTGQVRTVDTYNVMLLSDGQFGEDDPRGLLRAEALSNDDVRVFEAADERNALTLRGAGPALKFAANGTLLLTAGTSGVIRLWGVRSMPPAAE